jgi:hypothetical protein
LDVPRLLAVLLRVESAISRDVSACKGTPQPTAQAEYELALEHAGRGDYAVAIDAHQAVTQAAARAAAPQSQLQIDRAPVAPQNAPRGIDPFASA